MDAIADAVPAATPHPPPTPRRMGFPFADEDIPRHWFGANAVATHIANGLNLLFPLGERFFVRSVRHYQGEIDDPVLRQHVRGFFGQEGRHAHEHERFFEILRAQGYDVDTFLETYERIAYQLIERRLLTPPLRLATTAACEHFTAIMAENAFDDELLETAHPVMRELLLWHAAEEIEHKSVAFDVLQRFHPSYALRMAGLAIATITLASFWVMAVRDLLRQDGIDGREARRELARLRRDKPIGKRVFLRGIREYMRRDFHPWDNDNWARARSYLASVGRADG